MKRAVFLTFSIFAFLTVPAIGQDIGLAPAATVNLTHTETALNGYGGEGVFIDETYGGHVSFSVTTEEFDDGDVDFIRYEAMAGPSFVLNRNSEDNFIGSLQAGFSATNVSGSVLGIKVDETVYSPGVGVQIGALGTEAPVFFTMGASYFFQTEKTDDFIKGKAGLGVSF